MDFGRALGPSEVATSGTEHGTEAYGVLRSRATRNVWLLDELGVPYEHVPVIQVYRLPDPNAPGAPLHTASPEFKRINPNARIPALTDGDLVLNESLAINLYLAKKVGGPLGPKDVAEDGQMTMWSLWAMTECEPHSIAILYNTIGKPEPERNPEQLKAALAAIQQPLDVLDRISPRMAGSSWAAASRWPTSTSPRSCATPSRRRSSSPPGRR